MKEKNKVITVSKLRENIYRILDEIARTGIAVEIDRNGHKLKILPEEPVNKLDNPIKRPYLTGAPDEIVHRENYKHAIWK